MSRIDVQLTNPANKFFKWNGNKDSGGLIQYYDKEAKENVTVPFPFSFLVLDRVFTIGGGHDVGGTWSGFWSNAVQNLQTQQFTVKSKQGRIASGYYADIKGTSGIKFITGLYIAYKDEEDILQIGYLELGGAAMSAWIDFAKARDIYSGAFSITGSEQKKKGSNVYFEPVFVHKADISEESDLAAKELTKHVVEYLKARFRLDADVEPYEQEYSGMAASAGASVHDTLMSRNNAERPDWNPTDDDAPDNFDPSLDNDSEVPF